MSTDTTVITPEFRVSYPKVFKPERNDLNGRMQYSLVALFPPGADLSKLKAAAKAACVKKWGDNTAKWPKNLRDPFKDQGAKEKEDDQGNKYMPSGYVKGAVYLDLKTEKNKPGLVDARNQDIIDEADFYGGCYARAQVNARAYGGDEKNKANAGVSFYLNHVQKLRDGDSFGSVARNPSDVFQPVGESAGGGVFD
jgi:hypothetical protein